jgi:hypothetical protein
MDWKRSKSGIYTSCNGRWHACCVGKRNEWRLQDCRPGGRTRYYSSLKAAKVGAERHNDE